MKKYRIEYSETWKNVPMAFWVHKEIDGQPWYDAKEFSPPAPIKDINGNYKIYNVEIDGFTFIFSSKEQIEECINILSKKLLPSTIELSKSRTENLGPNSHWLSRLPENVKNWKYRQKAVKYLKKYHGYST
jgi:hypothetical protein